MTLESGVKPSVPIDTVGEGKGDFEKRKRMETSEMEKAAELLAIMKAPTTVCNACDRITKKVKGKSSTVARVPIASTASDKTVKAPTITSNTLSDSGQDLYALIEPPHITPSHRLSPSIYAGRPLPSCSFGRRQKFFTGFRWYDGPAKSDKYSAAYAGDLPRQTVPLFWVKHNPQKH
jgi:hypothetical protein